MPILVTERWSGPLLAYAPGAYRTRRIFDVTGVTNQTDAIAAVVAFDPSTAYNAQFLRNPLMYVDNQEAVVTGFNFWTVTVTYSTNPAGRHVDPGNPLLEPYRYSFDWQYRAEAADRDAFGNKIQNSAGQSFLSDIPTDVLNGFMYVERNEPFYDAIGAVAFSNAVNNANVTFFGLWKLFKGQACVRKIKPLTPITSAAVYCTIQYTIELRGGYKLDSDGYWDGFKTRVENDGVQGFWSNSGTVTSGPIYEMVDNVLRPTSMPVRLDKMGIPMLNATLSGTTIVAGRYFIGSPVGPSACVARPNSVIIPPTTIFEPTGDAWFVKVFPQTVKLVDLNSLGL